MNSDYYPQDGGFDQYQQQNQGQTKTSHRFADATMTGRGRFLAKHVEWKTPNVLQFRIALYWGYDGNRKIAYRTCIATGMLAKGIQQMINEEVLQDYTRVVFSGAVNDSTEKTEDGGYNTYLKIQLTNFGVDALFFGEEPNWQNDGELQQWGAPSPQGNAQQQYQQPAPPQTPAQPVPQNNQQWQQPAQQWGGQAPAQQPPRQRQGRISRGQQPPVPQQGGETPPPPRRSNRNVEQPPQQTEQHDVQDRYAEHMASEDYEIGNNLV